MKHIFTIIVLGFTLSANASAVRTLSHGTDQKYNYVIDGFQLDGFQPVSDYTICFEISKKDVCPAAYDGQFDSGMDYGSGSHERMLIVSCVENKNSVTVNVLFETDYDENPITDSVEVEKCTKEMLDFENKPYQTLEERDWR
ncbi:MAG: hypothetical protein ACJAS4_002051 [Bacteriovoracaceae bacterium]|jgi:hypothetical protein